MKIARIAVAAMAVLAFSAPAPAQAAPAEPPKGCTQKGGGIWFSPWGHATFEFAPAVVKVIEEKDIKVTSLPPVEVLGGGKALYMPVGFAHDNIEFGNRICYPGGFKFEDGEGHTFDVPDGFWLKTEPAGAFGVPVINGVRSDKEMMFGSFNIFKLPFGDIGFSEGGIKIRDWPFFFTKETADTLNGLFGSDFKAGDKLANLVPVLKYLPS